MIQSSAGPLAEKTSGRIRKRRSIQFERRDRGRAAIRSSQRAITDRAAFRTPADEAEALFGKLHALCNNAGIGILRKLSRASEDDWDWAIDVNLNSMFNG